MRAISEVLARRGGGALLDAAGFASLALVIGAAFSAPALF